MDLKKSVDYSLSEEERREVYALIESAKSKDEIMEKVLDYISELLIKKGAIY